MGLGKLLSSKPIVLPSCSHLVLFQFTGNMGGLGIWGLTIIVSSTMVWLRNKGGLLRSQYCCLTSVLLSLNSMNHLSLCLNPTEVSSCLKLSWWLMFCWVGVNLSKSLRALLNQVLTVLLRNDSGSPYGPYGAFHTQLGFLHKLWDNKKCVWVFNTVSMVS